MKKSETKGKDRPRGIYALARWLLLAVCIFSFLNILLLKLQGQGADFIPLSLGCSYLFAYNLDSVSVGIALGITALFFGCYLLSKRRVGWFIPGMVLYVLDMLFCLAMAAYNYSYFGIGAICHVVFLLVFFFGIRKFNRAKQACQSPAVESCED